MIRRQKRSVQFAGLAMVFAVTGCTNAVIRDANAQHAANPSVIKADQVNYEAVAPFVSMGSAWGDRSKGKHGTFGRFPGGAASPLHTHSGAYHGIVISGRMTNPFRGEAQPPEMGPGSYWYVPAGVAHITACVSKEPCTFYFHANGAFDFAPAKK